jgi:tetratricopeptide (TPR) repeat protein
MKRLAALLSMFLLLVCLAPTPSAEARIPYTTWALGPGGRLYLTQDAYTPLQQVTLPVEGAEDFFITPQGTVYVADTKGGRILRLNRNWQVDAEYGQGALTSPTGLWVDEAGTIYVADAGSKTVVLLDRMGNLIAQYGRPSEPLFGKNNEFLPRKIAVDARKDLYIVSEGSTNGLVMMNTDGHFIGYFGANPATMSLKMILQRTFLTEEQLAQFIKNEAASPSNVTIDPQSMVFTVTAGTDPSRSIRRFTVDGQNIFPQIRGSGTFRDINVSENGLVTAVDADGRIYEYDLTGMLLFVFGAKDQGDQRLGLLSNPVAIERYGNVIYVLDKDKNALVLYQATAFAQLVHQGVRLYVEGYYTEAQPYFEQVLRYNGSFIMAYQAIADAYFKQGDYARALTNYRYAEDRTGYSDAFWELRNVLLQRYLGTALLILLGLSLAQSIVGRLDRRYGWFDGWRRWRASLLRYKLVDDLIFLFRFIKQPADSFYYIKKKERGSLTFALLLYLWVVAVRVGSLYLTGFIFNRYASPSEIPVEREIVYLLLFFFLWNSANYLISTISDGEGRLRDVIIGSAYSLFPYALFGLPIALFSNLLSLNEVFLYTFSLNLAYAWTVLMFVIMVKEIHNYSFGETVRNILLTLFTMALMLLTGYILYVLFFQLFDFIAAIWREVQLRG